MADAEDKTARTKLEKAFFAGKLRSPLDKTAVCIEGAYLRWLFGGLFAWHHVYLGRSYQALLWLCSPGLGGICGIGFLRDLYRIPIYVDACNQTDHAREQFEMDQKYHKVPPWSFLRIAALFFFGNWFSFVGYSLGPSSLPEQWFTITSCIAGAFGIWLAGCACTNQTGGPFWKTCGAYLFGELLFGYGRCAAIVQFQWTRKWKRELDKPRLSLRKVLVMASLFWAVCMLCAIEHVHFVVDGNDGKPRRIHVARAAYNAYNEFDFGSFYKMFEEPNGFDWNWDKSQWQSRFNQRFKQMDITGEKHALRNLGMEDFIGRQYTVSDVKKAYRDAAKKWHPDHVPLSQKQVAEAKMQEINAAKDTLLGLFQSS